MSKKNQMVDNVWLNDIKWVIYINAKSISRNVKIIRLNATIRF
jgi:hypothetical protein